MGNDQSAPLGLVIDEKAIEITDFWIHHSSTVKGSNLQNLSIFISEPSLHSAANFEKPSPLERSAKNLMIYRHPCILKYITSWSKGSKFFLATEEVKPLIQGIGLQTSLQICIGLYSILQALLFIHEKALSSHNNVCSSSVYVTSEGSWKLGGFEYLCRFTELNSTYLNKIKSFRYDKAISPDENEILCDSKINLEAIDKYAFSVLAEEVLKLKNTDDVPGLLEFRELCKTRFKDISLSELLSHPFFTHEFICINAFLKELPIKGEIEKEDFFQNLVGKLKMFPEKIVAEQLGKLLLSRMVLLDHTAQTQLLPFIFHPKEKEDDDGLFTTSTFQIYLVPQLLQMFCIRDAPIRLLLLSHLNSFLKTFQIDDLKHKVLPELLVGIKDTDDTLVSTTLRALADLVPILGSSTVIGGNRGKLFTDGRPNKSARNIEITKSVLPKEYNCQSSPLTTELSNLYLSERPSPDGGEDKVDLNLNYDEEEHWSDWEGTPEHTGKPDRDYNSSSLENFPEKTDIIFTCTQNKVSEKPITNTSEPNIKLSKSTTEPVEEFDFFSDMEPVIEKTKIIHIDEATETESEHIFDVKLTSNMVDNEDTEWGCGEWEL